MQRINKENLFFFFLKIRGVSGKGKKKKHLFLLTLNTSFIDLQGKRVLKFLRKDLDLAFKDKKNGFEDSFQVDVTVMPAPNFAGQMQSTYSWARTRDKWQAGACCV